MSIRKILVLNYHQLSPDSLQATSACDNRFTIRQQMLKEHLELIRKLGIPVVTLNQVASADYLHEFAISLTFDDGNSSDYNLAFPLLKSFNFTATFFPVVSTINQAGKVSWEQLKEMSGTFTIGSHGMNHNPLTGLPTNGKIYELHESKRLLEEALGKPVKYFASPYGLHDRELIRLSCEAGYESIVSTQALPNCEKKEHTIIHRWNIRNHLSTGILEKKLLKKGESGFLQSLFLLLAATLKRMLGHKLSQKLINFIYQNIK